jgi:SAM-dependent methyltransferase
VRADMRHIPLRRAVLDSTLSVQSLEHVPDPDSVVAESARVLDADGLAVWVTPNRLTFARADEVIDPWHYLEYSPSQLHELCERWFGSVEIYGLFGSPRYLEFQAKELNRLDRLLRIDFLRLRRVAPRVLMQLAYSMSLTRLRRSDDPLANSISQSDFFLGTDDLNSSLDVIAVCRQPMGSGPNP